MPNIASVMKDEIVRLTRKEVRSETEGLKKAAAKYRSDMADLKRRVAMLEKLVTRLVKGTTSPREPRAESEGTVRFRFSAKRLAAKDRSLDYRQVRWGHWWGCRPRRFTTGRPGSPGQGSNNWQLLLLSGEWERGRSRKGWMVMRDPDTLLRLDMLKGRRHLAALQDPSIASRSL